MAAVNMVDVHKMHGNNHVIRGVSVDICDGEFVVLVGPSGCGKSTLLRMIAGLEEVSSGEISIGSRVVNHIPAKRRDIAMVFQSYALYPHLTVAQNIAFSLKLRGTAKTAIADAVANVARSLHLEELLDRYPRQLSGGQRQRVAMGRAIVRKPQVFLFDEPLSNLDAKLRVSIRTEMKELHQRLRTTTIYVTHDQVEAMTMASRIVVMRSGCVEQVGSPMKLYDQPANQFVAGFIGSPVMNFLPVEAEQDSIRIRSGPLLATIEPHIDATVVATFGIRPEHLQVVQTGADGAMTGTVAVLEPTGPETILIFEWQGGRLTALVRERLNLQVGAPISLRPMAGRGHIFNTEGIRLGAA